MLIHIPEANEGQRKNALNQMRLALTNQNSVPMYYVGGTLCIDIGPECGVIVTLDMEGLTAEPCRRDL